jgi:hypothetical protein
MRSLAYLALVLLLQRAPSWSTFLDVDAAPSAQPVVRRVRRPIRYRVSDTFCDEVIPRFREDRLLGFRGTTCDDVHAAVRAGFDVWERNTESLAFREANVTVHPNGTTADEVATGEVFILLQSDPTPRQNDKNEAVIAYTTGRLATELGEGGEGLGAVRSISVSTDTCWYTSSEFCHAVHRHAVAVGIVLSFAWILALLAVGCLMYRSVRFVEFVTMRLVAWTTFLAPPILFWSSLLPCIQCFDFVVTVAHEIGHAIGLGHSDSATFEWHCGCGEAREARKACDIGGGIPPLMAAYSVHRPDACPQRDDVDAVRTLYGGDCSQPIWCYETHSFASAARLAVAIVLAFVVAWCVVTLRVFCATRVGGKKGGPPPHSGVQSRIEMDADRGMRV